MIKNCDPCVDNGDVYTDTQAEPCVHYESTITLDVCKGMHPGVSRPWVIQAA